MSRTISATVEIKAPPDEVWATLVDLPAYSEWNPYVVEAEGVAAVGSRLSLLMKVGGKTFNVRPTVAELKEGRVLRWAGRFVVRGVFDAVHVHHLEPLQSGTRFVQSERFSGVLLPFLRKTVAETEVAFMEMNDALKRRVEARNPTGQE